MKVKRIQRPLSVKSVSDSGVFEGYGSVFHVEDSYREVVAPGAFKTSLESWVKKGGMPALLWQHNPDQPIGIYEEMREDSHGLYVKGRLLKDDVQLAGEAYALLKAGALSGLSIGYQTMDEDHDEEKNITTLKAVDLWETSLVTFPANDEARVMGVKNIKSIRDFETFLRDAGFSRKEACRIASHGYGQRDSVAENAEIEAMKSLLISNIEVLKNA